MAGRIGMHGFAVQFAGVNVGSKQFHGFRFYPSRPTLVEPGIVAARPKMSHAFRVSYSIVDPETALIFNPLILEFRSGTRVLDVGGKIKRLLPYEYGIFHLGLRFRKLYLDLESKKVRVKHLHDWSPVQDNRSFLEEHLFGRGLDIETKAKVYPEEVSEGPVALSMDVFTKIGGVMRKGEIDVLAPSPELLEFSRSLSNFRI